MFDILRQIVLFIVAILVLWGCIERETTDAKKAYRYWSGENPSSDISVIDGRYWQSAHWTKEYILYLKLKPSVKWIENYLSQNSLVIDTTIWEKPDDAPEWFSPSADSKLYRSLDSFDQGSRVLVDSISGVCYIYEIQL